MELLLDQSRHHSGEKIHFKFYALSVVATPSFPGRCRQAIFPSPGSTVSLVRIIRGSAEDNSLHLVQLLKELVLFHQ